MSTCPKCGASVEDGVKFCQTCGEAIPAAGQNDAQQNNFQSTINNLGNTPDSTDEFDQADINANKGLACLSYLSLLVLIPLFVAKESKFARFHVNQGLVLAVAGIALSVLGGIVGRIPFIGWILGIIVSLGGLVTVVFTIMGLINSLGGKAKELPIIGGFKIIK